MLNVKIKVQKPGLTHTFMFVKYSNINLRIKLKPPERVTASVIQYAGAA